MKQVRRKFSGDLFPSFKGRRPLGEAWLRVGAIIAEYNMDSYGVAR